MAKKQGTKKDIPAKAAVASKTKKSSKATSGGRKTEDETIAKVENYLADMYNAGIKEVKEAEILKITGYARIDSTGYRNAMKKLLKEVMTVEKLGKGVFALTERGIHKLQASGAITPEPTTNEEAQKQLKEKLFEMAKAPQEKIARIWDLLMDGKVHSRDELLQAAGYNRPDSTGYKNIMKWMKNLDLLDTSVGKSKFQINKARLFPFDE